MKVGFNKVYNEFNDFFFEIKDGLGAQRIMIEAIRSKCKDMVRRQIDLC